MVSEGFLVLLMQIGAGIRSYNFKFTHIES
jgi:hypothetical protein